jgi:hypothetical protein
LGIQFIPPTEIINLDEHQSTGYLKQVIYIPCNYNNSDWDIQEFLKDFGANQLSTLKSTQRRPVIITAAVLGCNKLCSKNGLWSVLEKTYHREMAKKITPESWVIPAQSAKFKTLLNTRQTTNPLSVNSPTAFILKKNIQGKRGLLLSNSRDTLLGLLSTSAQKDYAVAQYYLPNPYLIHGRKMNIRLYILITISKDSKQPEWWLYTQGKCIYTNREYRQLPKNTTIKSGTDRDLPLLEQHFTSLNLDADRVYSQEHCPESLAELHEYMSSRGENWPQIWKKIQLGLKRVAMAYLDKLSKPKLAQKAYQIFGADYIISADPKTGAPKEPYLLEFNKGPEMKYKSPQDPELKSGLQTDILELVLGQANTNTNTKQEKWILLNPVNKSKTAQK